jgi:hypothetical protein
LFSRSPAILPQAVLADGSSFFSAGFSKQQKAKAATARQSVRRILAPLGRRPDVG